MRTNIYLRFYFFAIFSSLFFNPSVIFAQTDDSVIFRDDFNRASLGNFWNADASWSIVNKAAFNYTEGTGAYLRTSPGYAQTSYVIRTTAKGFTNSYFREFRITFGQADLSTQEMYEVKYTAYMGGLLTLSRSSDNLYFPVVLDEAAIFPNFNASQWFDFKIAKYSSGLIQVYVDQGSGYGSVPILEAIDTTYQQLGHSGWQIDTQTSPETFYVDQFSAIVPKTDKPAVKEKPAEDDLITQVSAKSRKPYTVGKLAPGVNQFIDRKYTITTVPDYLNNASFIQSSNNDKYYKTDSFLTFFVKAPSILYVGYDPRGQILPSWLNGWTKVSDQIGTSDDKVGHLNLYSRSVDYGEVFPNPVILGGNVGNGQSGALTNYLLAAIKPPDPVSLQAEDANVSGAVVANNHTGYYGTGFVNFTNLSEDYIEWNVHVSVPGTYNLSFRFANGDPNDRFLDITDNRNDLGTADFSTTSSWDNWAFNLGPTVFLSAGTHKIRVTAIGSGGPNMDQLGLSFISTSAPDNTNYALDYNRSSKMSIKSTASSDKAFPNPFLQSTKIYYALKEKAKVSLSIFNLQGQQIQVLENSMHEAGNYESTFNADKFAKGVYIYKLQIGAQVKTGKLVKE